MKKSEKYLALTITSLMVTLFGPAFSIANDGGVNLTLSIMVIGTTSFAFSWYKTLSELDNE